jgi:peptidoglycan/LPS O-acetylase OafA/YrhL
VPILAGAVAAFTLYRIGWLLAGASSARIYFAPDTHADPLVVGCLLAVLRRNGLWVRSRLAWLTGASLLALVLVGFHLESLTSQSAGLLLTELAAVGLIFAAANGSCVLSLLPLVWLGRISYSLYLWHPMAANVIHQPWIALPVALALSWLSYRFVETRFRRHRGAGREQAASPSPAPALSA